MSGLSSERREQAFALLARLDPQAPDQVAANLDALSPDFAELVLGFAFADVLSVPVLISAPVRCSPLLR